MMLEIVPKHAEGYALSIVFFIAAGWFNHNFIYKFKTSNPPT